MPCFTLIWTVFSYVHYFRAMIVVSLLQMDIFHWIVWTLTHQGWAPPIPWGTLLFSLLVLRVEPLYFIVLFFYFNSKNVIFLGSFPRIPYTLLFLFTTSVLNECLIKYISTHLAVASIFQKSCCILHYSKRDFPHLVEYMTSLGDLLSKSERCS